MRIPWIAASIALALPLALPAQQPAPRLRGVVRAPDGRPLDGANVFVLETLDGTVTGADGWFAIPMHEAGTVTLVARRVGYVPERRAITPAERDSVTIVLTRAAPKLQPVLVEASRYSAGDQRSATLSSLEVATTPGAAADVDRAIQSLPGVQQVDEGTALFVRGGDYTETKVFLNGAVLLNADRLQKPQGTFMGTVNPFLLDGIAFSSGGFGARFGDALSGVVDLRTQGLPLQRALTASAGLAALSGSLAQPLSRELGLRAAVNAFDLRPLLTVNGSTRRYEPPPRGHDASGSLVWNSRAAGSITLFGIEQQSRLGVGVDDPSYSGTYHDADGSGLLVATWQLVRGRFAPSVSASTTRLDRDESFGVFALDTRLREQHLVAQTEWTGSDRLTLRGGTELERMHSLFDGSIPQQSSDQSPGARRNVLGAAGRGTRSALFAEGDVRVDTRTRLIVGLRSDASTLTGRRTWDPRLSLAMRAASALTLTGAWGVYHEVPDPMLFAEPLGVPRLPAMRATHAILGAQLGEGERMARVELYDKRYADLAQRTRDYRTVADGSGFARGVDLFLKGKGPFRTTGRLTYSYVRSRRTDPNSGVIADAPFEVPHSATLVIDRRWAGWQLGTAYRYASGRPFTPIVGATRDSAQRRWIPEYGAPLGERLPHFARLDLSVSHFAALSPAWKTVLYASVNNLLARPNVYTYTYSADYRERIGVPGLFNRSMYVGATLIH